MAQFVRPSADLDNTGVWTTTPLWSKIDDAGGIGDSVFAVSDGNPTISEPFTVDGSTVTDPAVSTGHVIRARWSRQSGTVANTRGVCQLRQGYVSEASQGTLIATLTGAALDNTLTTQTWTLTVGETDAITDYADLQFRIYAEKIGGGAADNWHIEYIELEVPDAGPPEFTGTVAVTQEAQTSAASGTVVAGPISGTVAVTQADQTSAISGTVPSYDHNTYFAPPLLAIGFTTSAVTDIEPWPFTDPGSVETERPLGDSHTVGFDFDLSDAPGDKKGFRFWIKADSTNASGFTIDAVRLIDQNGPTTLHSNASPGMANIVPAQGIQVYEIPDSAFSGDPALNDLTVELDVSNLAGGNNTLHVFGIRLSKSPFTAAQEASPPSSLTGADFAKYSIDGLDALGVPDSEAIVVIPDESGKGRHLLRQVGTGAIYDPTNSQITFPSGGVTRFIGHWGSRVTGNHIWHVNVAPVTTGVTQAVWSHANEFDGAAVPGDKNILGIDDDPGTWRFLLMSGDGTGPAHLYGTTVVTFDAYQRVTHWIQDAGNEHQWIGDAASPDVDGASGSNDLWGYSFGDRETDDRGFRGGVSEFWIIDGAAFTETNIDDARDEWENGPISAWTGTVAVTQDNQTSAIAGTSTPPPITGTSTPTQEDQTSTVSGTVAVPEFTGTVGATQDDQTSAADGTTAVPEFTGTSAVTQADQTSAAEGTTTPPAFTGTATPTQEDQVSAAEGTTALPEFTGTVAVTQADQTSDASGDVFSAGIVGNVGVTQDDQTSTISGTFTSTAITGTVGVTQDSQTAQADGTATLPAITGTVAVLQDNQTCTASGTVTSAGFVGSVAVTQENQVSDAAGVFTPAAITGSTAGVQEDQTSAISGTVANPAFTGTVGVTQEAQIGVATGIATPPAFTGTVNVTQDDQVGNARSPGLRTRLEGSSASGQGSEGSPSGVGLEGTKL